MANDMNGVNDIYNNGLNDVYGEMPAGETVEVPTQNVLVKTGVQTSIQWGDDGSLQNGLDTPATRFVHETINGDDVIKDMHTGLMWPKNWSHAMSGYKTPAVWSSIQMAMQNGQIPTNFYGDFTDWCIPNAQEFLSIYDFENQDFHAELGLLNVNSGDKWWCSTVKNPGTPIYGYVFGKDIDPLTPELLTSSQLYIACRRF